MSRVRKNKYVRIFVRRFGGARLIVVPRLLQLPLRLLARELVRRLPRERGLVAFGAPLDRFADNSAYLFLQLSGAPGLRCVWISGSREVVERLRAAGYEAELRISRAGLRACLQAEWYVVTAYVSDVNRWAHDGARLLNLWHGIPLKTIERDILNSPMSFMYGSARSPRAMAFADETRVPDAVLSTSPFISERCFASAFGVARDRCLDFGYPRSDHFFAAQDEPANEVLIKEPRTWRRVRDAPFVIGYFPTWRDDDSPFMQRSGLSIERLAEVVAAQGGVLLFKPHFNTTLTLPEGHAVVLHPDDDLNVYLPLCSALITDYSSVAFDFMLLDRPILYFVPDLEHYRHGRGLYFEPETMMPGPLLYTAQELYDAVGRLGPSSPADPRVQEIRELVWNGYRGDAGARLQDFIASGARATAAPAGRA
ncbi:MAG: teichoic acid glycerol-phosphate transferase [Solirubrobacteraceae bacterium]|jgi:CDP-glycerol glycerophosphotransferase (TagB/SpsB family)|nr:teichoic acid glycerol-phosphate transferase [Solirubrobacteraceae bacterium]